MYLKALFLLILIGISGCRDESEIVFNEFLSTPIKISAGKQGKNVVGLKLRTQGSISSSIEMHIGFEGYVYKTIKIPSSGSYSGRFDWYDSPAEISFADTDASGQLTLYYHFLIHKIILIWKV